MRNDRERNNAYMKKYMRNRRLTEQGKKEYRLTDRNRNIVYRLWLAEQKAKPCDKCGGDFPSYVMQFHHINSTDKTRMVSAMAHNTKENVLKEIAKCDLLCANCHAIVTHRGISTGREIAC